MARKLLTHVHVLSEDGFSTAVFGPDDEVPAWAAEQMGDHCFEPESEPESGSDSESEKASAKSTTAKPDQKSN